MSWEMKEDLYSAQIGLRNSTQPGALWIPAFAGMTVIEFFANHSVWSIASRFGGSAHTSTVFSMSGGDVRQIRIALTMRLRKLIA